MLIESLHFSGYGKFPELELPLWTPEKPDRRVTVLIGENGSGKSTVMEGTTTLLTWLVARIRNDKGAGSPIEELKIHNSFNTATLTMSLRWKKETFSWALTRTREGVKRTQESALKSTSALAEQFRQSLTDDKNTSLPLVAYYPTERYVLDVPKKIRTRHEFRQINGYEESLTKGIDFRLFFEWFRDREDARNEAKIGIEEILPFVNIAKFIKAIHENISELSSHEAMSFLDMDKLQKEDPVLYSRVLDQEFSLNDPQYFAVLKAIEAFMPGYDKLRIQRKPRMRMLINKGQEELEILQLSQGERSLLALVGDIARRLAMMNPSMSNPLDGEGIILIDEVDLHLHPRWQRTIVRRLRETFPNCQFLLTTHSPLVISDPDNIQAILLKNGTSQELGNLYGMDIEQVLLEVMDADLRDPTLQKKLDELMKAIQNRDYSKVNTLRNELAPVLPPDHRELTRADIYLRRQKVLDAKNY